MEPFDERPLPAVVGHRGAPRRARGDTPAAFAAAAQEGATWVELDARLSADDVVVVHHDAVTADGRAIRERSAEQLAALDVHTLVEILDGLPLGLGVDVECKNLPGDPDFHDDEQHLAGAVVDVLRPRVRSRPLMTSSFNPLTVEALAAGLPEVVAGLLHMETLPLSSALEIAEEIGARALCPHVASHMTCVDVAAVHATGRAVMVWTVDEPARARELAAAGVDALCTNDPAGIVRALSAERRPAPRP